MKKSTREAEPSNKESKDFQCCILELSLIHWWSVTFADNRPPRITLTRKTTLHDNFLLPKSNYELYNQQNVVLFSPSESGCLCFKRKRRKKVLYNAKHNEGWCKVIPQAIPRCHYSLSRRHV